MQPKWVVMGRVAAPHGVRGWFRVQSYGKSLDGLSACSHWWLGKADEYRKWLVAEWQVHGNALVARLDGVTDRTTAESLRGMEVAIPREQLPAAGDNEYYWTDLIGLQVTSVTGEKLGKVEAILETGANDVLVVRDENRERLIPFVAAVLREVCLPEGRMVVDWEADY